VRESIEAKAPRYLSEGRLLIERVDESGIAALCAGSNVYELRLEDGEWSCSCPATLLCSHLLALQLVTTGGHPHAAEEASADG
jgi:hypothetical protein